MSVVYRLRFVTEVKLLCQILLATVKRFWFVAWSLIFIGASLLGVFVGGHVYTNRDR